MMSASTCRARSDALIRSADRSDNYDVILELEAAALCWRNLAALADVQDICELHLAQTKALSFPE